MIIQSIALLDQLDKDLNTFAMRVREWYCWHFPELRELVKDNYVFARCAAYIQDRTQLTEVGPSVRQSDWHTIVCAFMHACLSSHSHISTTTTAINRRSSPG
jgi:RNA processing factor Prp31